MEALEALFTRRSIRKFKKDPITEEALKGILRAAMYAPSAANQQPWGFVVIKDRNILNQIPTVHPYAEMIKEAPVAIAVCGDLSLEKHQGYWVQDCSAASHNLCLAAHALGIGNVWLGIYPREDRVMGIREILKLPENVVPLSIIVLGHPDETAAPPEERFNPAKIHNDKW
ncbi:MAG: nitroreductase family protein [Bacteroidota bacterium]